METAVLNMESQELKIAAKANNIIHPSPSQACAHV